MRTTLTLLVACFLLVGLGPVAAEDEPSASGSTTAPCVDVKPDDPTDPVDIYDCVPEGEP